MTLSTSRNDMLLDISLAIGVSLNLHQMLETSLPAFLNALDCSSGSVLFLEDMAEHYMPFEPVCAIPQSIFANEVCQAALLYLQPFVQQERLSELMASLPVDGQSAPRHYFGIFALPAVGVMILTSDHTPFSAEIMGQLQPLVGQLTQAVRRCLQNQALEKKLRLLQERQPAARQAMTRSPGNEAQAGAAALESEKRFRLLTEAAFEAIIITAISHELRTPLASIMGFVETLLSGMPGPLTEVQTRFLQNSYKSSERLLELVEELIAATCVQKGSFSVKWQQTLPDQIVDKIVQKNTPFAGAKGVGPAVDNRSDLNRICLCDPDKIEYVVNQLLKNAIKFTPEGGQVTVSSRTKDDAWYFDVVDTGIGIPEDEFPFLFNRFFRAGNAKAAEIQGAGLGLCLAKAVVEAHNGQIGVESRLNQGTKAWFSIPLIDKI